MLEQRSGKDVYKVPITLVLLGGFLILVSGLLAVLGEPTGVTFTDGHLMIVGLTGVSVYHGIVEMFAGLLLLLYTFYIIPNKENNIQNWSVAVLVFSLLSLVGGGGFFIGFALSLLGGILGIAYMYVAAGRQTRYVGRVTAPRTKPYPGRAKQPARIIKEMKPEERRLYDLINEAEGAIFQAELVEKTGFSKVKVSRILDKMEGRGLIERKRRGMTNMVVARRPDQ